MQVLSFLPYVYTGFGSSHTPMAVARGFAGLAPGSRLYVPSLRARPPQGVDLCTWMPAWLPRPLRGGRFHQAAQARVVERLLADLRRAGPGAVVWLWPNAGLDTVRRLKDAGAFLVREMINTHSATYRQIILGEALRSGLSGPMPITDAFVAEETAELALVDRVVSPAEGVDRSLLAAGVADERIYRSHFGWDPARFPTVSRHRDPVAPFTALFVGEITVRKGAHLALRAWREAGIEGEFHLLGAVSPELAPLLACEIARGGVRHTPFTADPAPFYRQAGCLFFPTLEEGAPLVCYEAAACGLPVITGPMGTARFISHGHNGIVVDPHDQAALVAALKALADGRRAPDGLHARLSAAAASSAQQHRWEDAARHRLALLQADRDKIRAKPLFSRV
ncbi:glycosyltransferase [Alteraurantiacibacter buctensis]|nr:glycosyltransferase family 4 protein [Alteraurantiacibacter buctensis]